MGCPIADDDRKPGLVGSQATHTDRCIYECCIARVHSRWKRYRGKESPLIILAQGLNDASPITQFGANGPEVSVGAFNL